MDNAPQPQDTHKISNTAFAAMSIVAILLDLISLIPIVNVATLAFAGVIFTFWWWKLGLGLLNFKKALNYALGALVEVIPILSWLPGITVVVVMMFVFTRAEEKAGVNLTGQFSKTKKLTSKKGGRQVARQKTGVETTSQNGRISARSKNNTRARRRNFVKLPNNLESEQSPKILKFPNQKRIDSEAA